MASTLLLDVQVWDLVLDVAGNIAVATEPYSLAQDAASAIKTFLGEVYWDTTIGVPYLSKILGKNPSLGYLKSQLIAAAKTVPDVDTVTVYLTGLDHRSLGGQVQVTSKKTAALSAANFVVVSPQGGE